MALLAAFFGPLALDYFRVGVNHGAIWLIPLFLGVIGLASYEIVALFRHSTPSCSPPLVYIGVSALVIAWAIPLAFPQYVSHPFVSQAPSLALAFSVCLVFASEFSDYHSQKRSLMRVSQNLMAISYLGGLGGFLAGLRACEPFGWIALVSMVSVVKASDIGAFFVGRVFGRVKLTPRLSPGKTLEGAIGGVAVGCLVSYLFFATLAPQLAPNFGETNTVTSIAYGFAISIAGIVGDLTESLLKREAGHKDSSHLIPGLGGMLDVLDSMLVAAPVAYLYWKLNWIGPQ